MNNTKTWLAIDTTGQGCHLGLYHNSEFLTLSDMSPQSHAKLILPMIESLLNQAGIQRHQLTGIIYTQGPGSFTGVRIGVSVVQGLALALGIPTLGVSSLLALAWQGLVSTGKYRLVSIIDARMGQFYYGDYQFGARWHIHERDYLATPDVMVIHTDVQCLIGDVDTLLKTQPALSRLEHHARSTIDMQTLFSLVDAGLAQKQLHWNNGIALPIYLRHDVAALPKKQASIQR